LEILEIIFLPVPKKILEIIGNLVFLAGAYENLGNPGKSGFPGGGLR